jgi:hypothetical protein
VWHYTCNSPSDEKLALFGIEARGEDFGVQRREVLKIPIRYFMERGVEVDPCSAEMVIRKLERLII